MSIDGSALTEKELAFRNAVGTRAYAKWAQECRAQWALERQQKEGSG